MPDLSPAQKTISGLVSGVKKYLIHVSRILSVPGLSPFVGSVCQTGMDRFFYLQQSV